MPKKFGSIEERRTYQCWSDMKHRCSNKNNHAYKDYGQRGIGVCDRWLNSYESFIEDMGLKPDKHTLDRIDVNSGYGPDNCRWATYKTQARNTRANRLVTFRGITKTLVAWAEDLNIPRTTLSNRLIRFGWSVEKALTTPTKGSYTYGL